MGTIRHTASSNDGEGAQLALFTSLNVVVHPRSHMASQYEYELKSPIKTEGLDSPPIFRVVEGTRPRPLAPEDRFLSGRRLVLVFLYVLVPRCSTIEAKSVYFCRIVDSSQLFFSFLLIRQL